MQANCGFGAPPDAYSHMNFRVPVVESEGGRPPSFRSVHADRTGRERRTGGTRRGPHRVNAGYTLLARLLPARGDAARALLDDFTRRDRLPFARSKTTHFATITVIPEQRYGEEVLPAALMFATSFSGPARSHVRELVGIMGDPLRELFEHCEGFAGAASLERFILAQDRKSTRLNSSHH